MSLEIQNYSETILKKEEILNNAEVIDFPKDVINYSDKIEMNNSDLWKLYDKSNLNEDGDQLRTVIGICLMFTMLILIGLYSNFI